MNRDYAPLRSAPPFTGDVHARMTAVVDLLWEQFKNAGVSWVGFYVPNPDNADELLLGPRRDKPACSPIGLHGACGRAFLSRQPLVVHDVRELGENYIACDPRDQSEVVIPLLAANGTCTGVLDVDSFDVGAFDDHDVRELTAFLARAGLAHGKSDR